MRKLGRKYGGPLRSRKRTQGGCGRGAFREVGSGRYAPTE